MHSTNPMEAGEGGPSCLEVGAKASLEIFGLLVLTLPMAYVYVLNHHTPTKPFQRGFFCDDQALKHPYSEQQVPIVICVALWGLLAITLIFVVEIIRATAVKKPRRKPINDSRIPWFLVELYRHFGYFTLGALTTLLFTELAKYTIGRLRPHYLSLCGPRLTPELCHDEFGYQRFVTEPEEEICENLKSGNVTQKQLNEARLSFLSGHSSFSFFCGMFLIIYLQARLNAFPRIDNCCLRRFVRTLKVLRPFLQFGMVILSFWVSLTRISDYFHHPLDVIMGAIVGITFAIITLVVIGDIFTKPDAFWANVKCKIQNKHFNGAKNEVTTPLTERRAHGDPEGWIQERMKYIDE